MTTMSPGNRAIRALDPLHALTYFAPEGDEEYTAVGLRPGGMGYFAARSAPMGAVAPGVTSAAFYNFNPDLIARYLPRAWTLATPESVVEARWKVADRALRRLLGEDVIASPEVAEIATSTRAAADGLPVTGRALFAGHADLPWPEQPHLAMWHGITLLREYRGDGHVAALVGSGLSGIEALVLHVATGRSFTEPGAKMTRGWSDEQWAVADASLRGRGLLDADGVTETGHALRAEIEAVTDRADDLPWRTLGAERTARLTELGRSLTATAVGNGAFPAGLFSQGQPG